jgi:hypothetical protein
MHADLLDACQQAADHQQEAESARNKGRRMGCSGSEETDKANHIEKDSENDADC